MDPSEELRDVAKRGDTAAFHTMLGNDPLLLEKATLSPLADNILHIASAAGNLDFVTDILYLKPGFAWDGNKDGLTPLHMASALGHDDIVDVLLEVGQAGLCLLQDNQGRTPLHYATINGKIPVMEKLLLKCPEALEIETSKGETVLHLALKNKQANAFRLLAQELRDDRRLLIFKYRRSIKQLAKETNQLQEFDCLDVSQTRFRVSMPLLKRLLEHLTDEQLFYVVASLIATVTFQAAVNPPPAIWDRDKKMDYKCLYQKDTFSGSKMFDNCPVIPYMLFMLFNSLGFFSSVMFMVSTSKGSIRQLILATSLFSLVYSYTIAQMAMFPDSLISVTILACSILGVGVGVAFSFILYWSTALFLWLKLRCA